MLIEHSYISKQNWSKKMFSFLDLILKVAYVTVFENDFETVGKGTF